MSDSRYASRPVLALSRWILDNTIRIDDYPEFLPEDRLTHHLECNDLSVLETILKSFFPKPGEALRLAKKVAYSYPRVFCILLEIQRLSYLEAFVDEDKLSDKHLPFDSEPATFPPDLSDTTFFSTFHERQWRYCAADLKYMQTKHLNEKQPLPITKKIRRAGGASSEVYEIEVVPRYNSLIVSS
jgi:hypothetical protein